MASQKINPLKVDVVDAIFRIGCEVDAKGQFWNGALDEIRIWSVARTEDEIRVSMNSHLTGQEDGLVGYWNFDDGTTKDLTAIATVSFSFLIPIVSSLTEPNYSGTTLLTKSSFWTKTRMSRFSIGKSTRLLPSRSDS